ncbi:MAG: NUDIX domain-containing protein [Haloarculaceae archaeon]
MAESYFRGEVTQRGIVFGPDGDVLLVSSGLRPWTFPGGRIEVDTEPEPALRRAIYEDVGLQTTVRRPVKTVTDVWGNGDQPVYAVLYRAEARSRNVELSDDRDDFCWYTPEGAIEEMPFRVLEEAIERAIADRENDPAVDTTA